MGKPKRSARRSSLSGSENDGEKQEAKNGDGYRAVKRWPVVAGVGGPLLLFFFIYGMRLNHVVGHPYVDDGYYVLLAKALATGQGYTLINAPSSGIMPLYPPGFAAVLSFIFRISPQFPENLWLLKMVSIAAMLGVGMAVYYDVKHIRELPAYLALGMTVATFLSPGLVHYATSSMMSECVYALIQLLTIIAIERCAKSNDNRRWRYALLGAGLASLAFLTRSIGIALVVAAVAYLLKERLARAVLIFIAATALFAGPWIIYSRFHAPTPEQQQEQKGYITYNYTTQFWQKSAGTDDAGVISSSELPGRVWGNIQAIGGEKFGLIIAPRLLPVLGAAGMGILSLILSLLALAGFVSLFRKKVRSSEIYVLLSLLTIVFWPWDPVRFLLPLTPFLLFYVVTGAGAFYRRLRRGMETANPKTQFATMAAVVWLVAVLNIVGNFHYIQRSEDQHRKGKGELAEFDDVEAMLKWTGDNVPSDAVFASLNPALVYLYTGRKTISAQDPIGSWEKWKQLGVRYLVLTSPYGLPQQDAAGKKPNVVYQSRRNPNVKVVDLGPSDSRAPWGTAPIATTK